MGRLTDAGCVEDIGASGMEVREPGEVVDFGVDDDPLQTAVSDELCLCLDTCQVALLVVLRFDEVSACNMIRGSSLPV